MLHLIAVLAAVVVLCARAADPEAEKIQVRFHQQRVNSRPDDAGALRMLAMAQVRLAEASTDAREYDRAWTNLDQAESLEPGNPDTLRARARLLLSRHRFPQALALARYGLTIAPQDTDLLWLAGDAAFETGALEAAAGYYEKLHAVSPQLNTWARLAQLAEARNQLPEAARMLGQAMETGRRKGAPTESIAWCHAVLGEVRLKLGSAAGARRHYELGLESNPDHPLVLEHLAELEKLEGNLAASEAAYRKLLARRPDPVNQLKLAEVLRERGSSKEAESLRSQGAEQIRQAVELGNEGFLRPLAELELEAGRFEQAATLAFRDLALRPTVESKALLEKINTARSGAAMTVGQGQRRQPRR
jgi:tetratricopeptide (TPR) repeat protein